MLLQIPLAAAWTFHETFAWQFATASADLPLFIRHWIYNTLMFLALLGAPPLWWQWRTRTHPHGAGKIGQRRDPLTDAHILLFWRRSP